MKQKFFSTSDIARMLGVSRVTVFKRIKSGRIKASKVGRVFAVAEEDIPGMTGRVLTEKRKKDIEIAVEKAVKEYGRTLELLGRE